VRSCAPCTGWHETQPTKDGRCGAGPCNAASALPGTLFRVSPANIVDNKDGTYTVKYTPPAIGDYYMEITRNGDSISPGDTGYPVSVIPGRAFHPYAFRYPLL